MQKGIKLYILKIDFSGYITLVHKCIGGDLRRQVRNEQQQ